MRLSPWGRLVLVSALLVIGGSGALLASDLASREHRLVSYPVSGSLDALEFDLDGADIVVVGGGTESTVEVQRRERSAFGRTVRTSREVGQGVFRVRSRCPQGLPDTCAVRYRIVVPDNVPVRVSTDGGDVRFSQYRGSARVTTGSGDVDISGYCGFSLVATAASGDIAAGAACPPQRLALRSTTGSVRAVVPAGRYQIDAQSASGRRVVRGVTSTPDAPFTIQALSSSGDVVVEDGR